MSFDSYPALYKCADEASNNYQSKYLFLIKTEYLLLILASILSMNLFNGKIYYTFYAFVFLIGVAVLLVRILRKPEQDWYGCRALAESVKTLTWRYIMRAEPFALDENGKIANKEFREHLNKIFDASIETAKKIESKSADQAQITSEMTRIRELPLEDRKKFYSSERINEQRSWYTLKARENKINASKWVFFAITAYLLAAGLAISRIAYPNLIFWPIEPIIVAASSIIGWMQIKKFNELGEAYTVTAHEIGMISPTIDEATTPEELSNAVNDAELAFSREHTMWIARTTE